MVLICSVAVGCNKECNGNTDEQLAKWTAAEPDSYGYTVRMSFFSSPEALGPYRFEIKGGELDTIYFVPFAMPVDTNNLFDGWDDYTLVQEYAVGFDMASVFERLASYDKECDVAYDDTYHFPTEFRIPSDPEISDSGFSIYVTDFELL